MGKRIKKWTTGKAGTRVDNAAEEERDGTQPIHDGGSDNLSGAADRDKLLRQGRRSPENGATTLMVA